MIEALTYAAAGAVVFLLVVAIGLNLLPHPKRFGFDVRDVSRQEAPRN